MGPQCPAPPGPRLDGVDTATVPALEEVAVFTSRLLTLHGVHMAPVWEDLWARPSRKRTGPTSPSTRGRAQGLAGTSGSRVSWDFVLGSLLCCDRFCLTVPQAGLADGGSENCGDKRSCHSPSPSLPPSWFSWLFWSMDSCTRIWRWLYSGAGLPELTCCLHGSTWATHCLLHASVSPSITITTESGLGVCVRSIYITNLEGYSGFSHLLVFSLDKYFRSTYHVPGTVLSITCPNM